MTLGPVPMTLDVAVTLLAVAMTLAVLPVYHSGGGSGGRTVRRLDDLIANRRNSNGLGVEHPRRVDSSVAMGNRRVDSSVDGGDVGESADGDWNGTRSDWRRGHRRRA